MKKPNLIIATAWAVHAVAWFVPVIKDGVRLPDGLPGWEAFRFASVMAIRPTEWYFGVLSGASSGATVLFIVGSPWIVLFGSCLVRRVSAWVIGVAFVVNAHWFVLFGSTGDLRIGYYLWWLSFGVLAVGLFISSRKDPVIEPASETKVAAAVRSD